MKIKLLLMLICLSALVNNKIYAQETITINAGLDSGLFYNYTGFIHGQTNLKSNPIGLDLLTKLKPKYWRNANWNQTQFLADSLNINTTLVISDFYAGYKGGYAFAKPWLNWVEYEDFVDTLIDLYTAAGIAPTYWDIWNEPNSTFYWSGNFTQFVECIKRTKQIALAISPSIKLVAPSINNYSCPFFEMLLDTLALNGVALNAISWHEFGLPDSLINHVNDIRNKISSNPLWGNPEIHINEYSPSETNQIPAYRLGWLYHLEKSNVNWANTACWDNNYDGSTLWSGCSYGLNGLFWHDEQSPLPVYWVQRAYADMILGDKFFCSSSDPKTLALSCKFDSLQEMRILVGRYYSIYNGLYLPADIGKDSANVAITINNYPYLSNGTIPLVIQKIPKGDSIFQNTPFFAPITVYNGNVSVTGGTINFTLNNFKDGDVYYVYLNSNNILTIGENTNSTDYNIKIYPNPFSFSTQLQTNTMLHDATITVYDSYGKKIKQINNLTGSTINFYRNNLPNGIYYIRITDNNNPISTGKIIIVE